MFVLGLYPVRKGLWDRLDNFSKLKVVCDIHTVLTLHFCHLLQQRMSIDLKYQLPLSPIGSADQYFLSFSVLTGLPLRGGDVAVYVFDVNQPSLPTLICSVLVSVSVFTALSTVFHSINSSDNSFFPAVGSCGRRN